MKFYTKQHQFYWGIDLHTKKMDLCILESTGEIVLHRHIKTDRDVFLKTMAPFREDIVVAVEGLFTWYWIADRCMQEGIPFVLGHALDRKAIHGGTAKNAKIDSQKIAVLLRGGMLPIASVYPANRRATRDLLRRRNHLIRKRAELSAHIPNTRSQYNLPDFWGRIAKPQHRAGIVERFAEPSVPKMIATDLAVREASDPIRAKMEHDSIRMADQHDPVAYALLNSIPGIGSILGLVILSAIGDISRFPPGQDVVSYSRLVKSAKESHGQKSGSTGKKIGNAHRKWALSEAAALFRKGKETGKKEVDRLANKHGKGKALSILAHKRGRTVSFL